MLRFALKSMANRRAKLIMTALSVVLTAAVALLAYNISTQVSEGIVNTAAKYDLIIGPSGSATQLAMNTMFFTDKPLGTIPASLVDEIKASGLVNEAIPFSMGDSYNAAPIVGTDAQLLSDKKLKAGEMYSAALEAVVGSDVAQTYGLSVGDVIVSSHGLAAAHAGVSGAEHAAHPLTVTGILARSDTAYDNAVFTPIETIWALHDHEAHESEKAAEDSGDAAATQVPAEPEETDTADAEAEASDSAGALPAHTQYHAAAPAEAQVTADSEEDSEEAHDHDEDGAICAILIRSKGFNAYSQLMNTYGNRAEYLAINPNTVLREVMENVDLSRRIVYLLCAVILIMNLFVVTVIALLNMVDSRQEIRLMRLIGISMRRISQLYLIQNAIAGVAAMGLSLLGAHLCLLGIRGVVARMGIVLNASHVYPMEWGIVLLVFALSIVPTAICTRIMAGRDSLDRC